MNKETIVIDGIRYYADRPRSCRGQAAVKLIGKILRCIIFTIVQHTWNSMAILIVMEVILVLITVGTGVIDGILQIASESLGSFMRS